MNPQKKKALGRARRKMRVRRSVFGEPGRPRLSVFRSNRHIYAQIIDDVAGRTLASASTLAKELKGKIEGSKPKERARAVGELLGGKAKAAGIANVVFDRNGFRYHGRIRELAEAARKAGLQF
jgi:large subunit ribosomal protein L18